MGKGLVLRWFDGGYFICNGKAPEGKENDGELYVGDSVKWFDSYDTAKTVLKMINEAYGKTDDDNP